jgi:hypothetical protein
MRRKLAPLGLGAVLVLVVAVTSACSLPGNAHWPNAANAQTVIFVTIPAEVPGNSNNDSAEYRDIVEDAAFQWDRHPDIEVVVAGPDIENGCDDAYDQAEEGNCFEMWEADVTVANPIEPYDIEEYAPCWPFCAFAWRLSTGGHYFNHDGFEEDTQSNAKVVMPAEVLDETTRRFTVCHEIGHMLGLEHPADGDDPDTEPDQPGPCTAAGLPDRPGPTDTHYVGWDFTSLDQVYDRCHHDAFGPTGVPLDIGRPPPDGEDEINTAPDGPPGGTCSSQLSVAGLPDGQPKPDVVTDSLDALVSVELVSSR